MTDRHPTANACQRSRRKRYPRIDYYPSAEALELVRANLGDYYPDNILSGVIDRIVIEWAEANGQRAGIKYGEVEKPMTAATAAGVCRPVRAGAYESGDGLPEFLPSSRTRGGANDSGEGLPPWIESWLTKSHARDAAKRVTCGARRHRDGQPCKAKSEPGKLRCKWHGGRSTGPRTDEGKARALANLKQNRRAD